MRTVSEKLIFWTPRILSIIFISFLALMSLDIFDGNYGFWGTILGLIMHNIPTFILLAILLISWKRKRGIIGGVAFTLAGLLYTVLVLSNIIKTGFEWYYLAWILQIAGISFFIGILFVVGWLKKKKEGAD